ncbi:class I SAM-dependent methyltransferase [Lentzea tibetensis]|uniref:Class I SAM-dependent methyltransferase n=1 Tax=Lentzea tibetensis TaxID=2591470 RepID=A0A563EZT3_9PSEU|nr:class I SAM-dependent methyltransferase [Lentzea tibetensis]TWP53001.1 class I SAM-dependent methyltransferase [Lentzea tibetensis]
MDFLDTTRAGWDTAAVGYAEMYAGELEGMPLWRALFAAFAELVDGPVVEVGSGPGCTTAHLSSLGLDVSGIDLSPEMVAVASRQHPDLRFTVGSMTALDLPDAGLAGLVAWYSIINIPPVHLPGVFAEFHRVLAPGGHVLLGFQVRDEPKHLTSAFGHEISLVFQALSPEFVVPMLVDAGFVEVARMLCAPDEKIATPTAHLLFRKG